MENLVNLFFVHISINILIFIFKDYLKKKINIYDYPDFKKKLHKRPIPLIGGWILLFNLIFFLFSSYSQLSILEIKIIFCSFFFIIVGALDDKYQWQPPVAMPVDDKRYTWSEDTLNWVEVDLGS